MADNSEKKKTGSFSMFSVFFFSIFHLNVSILYSYIVLHKSIYSNKCPYSLVTFYFAMNTGGWGKQVRTKKKSNSLFFFRLLNSSKKRND